MNKKRIFKISLIIILSLAVLGVITVFALNAYVKNVSKDRIITPDEAEELEGVDCIIVLGCLVHEDGTPSDRLADRVQGGIDLYERGVAPKIIMSGDHGSEDYDEVGAMKRMAVESGVGSSDVFMDHLGFSTYETVYRAKEVFGAEKIVLVTQEYHLYRALYIAEKLGIEAYGVSTDYHTYEGQTARNIREVFARCKDVIYSLFKPEPDFIGEEFFIDGDGDATNNYSPSEKKYY